MTLRQLTYLATIDVFHSTLSEKEVDIITVSKAAHKIRS